MKFIALTYCLLLLVGCSNFERTEINNKEFNEVLESISKGWNEGNAELAAHHFADSAVYEEPPKKQFYKGKEQLFNFFGGINGYDIPMKMKWHNLAFCEDTQVGFGEYTFAMNNQYHGIVVMQFKNRKIIKWREYQYQSNLDWKSFTGESEFSGIE